MEKEDKAEEDEDSNDALDKAVDAIKVSMKAAENAIKQDNEFDNNKC